MNLLEAGQGGGGLRLRVAGTPVLLEWTFLVWSAVIGFAFGDLTLAVAWVLIVTVSILVHELGHAAALRSWGVPSRIVLHVMGGVTTHEAKLPTRWSRIAVSLAGPAAGMVLLGLPAVLIDSAWPAPTPWDDVLYLVVWVNLGWALVNLLPVLPLDGGHVAHELLDAGTRGRGELPARWLSVVTAAAAGAWALTNGFVFGAVFAGFFVLDNIQAIRGRRDRDAAADLRPAAAALGAGDTATTLALAAGVLRSARDVRARAMALELTAWAHLGDDDPAAAVTALAALPPDVAPSGHLRALLTEADPAERVNAPVDAWLVHRSVPAGIYPPRLASGSGSSQPVSATRPSPTTWPARRRGRGTATGRSPGWGTPSTWASATSASSMGIQISPRCAPTPVSPWCATASRPERVGPTALRGVAPGLLSWPQPNDRIARTRTRRRPHE